MAILAAAMSIISLLGIYDPLFTMALDLGFNLVFPFLYMFILDNPEDGPLDIFKKAVKIDNQSRIDIVLIFLRLYVIPMLVYGLVLAGAWFLVDSTLDGGGLIFWCIFGISTLVYFLIILRNGALSHGVLAVIYDNFVRSELEVKKLEYL